MFSGYRELGSDIGGILLGNNAIHPSSCSVNISTCLYLK